MDIRYCRTVIQLLYMKVVAVMCFFLKPLLDVFGRVLFTPRLLVFLKSETDRGRLYMFLFIWFQ